MEEESIGALVLELKANGDEYINGLKEALGETESFAESATAVFGATATAAVAIFGLITTAAIHSFSQTQDAIIKGTATMSDATGKMRGEMLETARELSREGNSSLEELTEAYGHFAEAGKNAEQSVKDLAVADEYATAASTNMKTAIEDLVRIQSAAHLTSQNAEEDAKNLRYVSDLLVASAVQGRTSVVGMSNAVQQLTRYIPSMNGGLREATSTIAAFTQSGQTTVQAVSSVESMMRTLAMATGKGAEAWRDYGVSAYGSDGKLKPLADILDTLRDRMSGFDDAQKAKMLSDLGFQARTVENIKVMLDIGDSMKQTSAALEDVSGAAKKLKDDNMTPLVEQMKQFNNIWKVFINEIGPPLTQTFTIFIKSLNEAFLGLTKDKDAIADLTSFLNKGLRLALDVIIVGAEAVNIAVNTVILTVQASLELVVKLVQTIQVAFQWVRNLFTHTAESAKALKEAIDNLKSFKDDTMVGAMAHTLERIEKGWDLGVKVLTGYEQAAIEAGKTTETFGDSGAKAIAGVTTEIKEAKKQVDIFAGTLDQDIPETLELIKFLGEPWVANAQKIRDFNIALNSGQVTLEQYTIAMEKLNLKGSAEDPFEKAMVEVMRLDAAFEHGVITANEYQNAVAKALMGGNDFIGSKTLNGGVQSGKVDPTSKFMQNTGIDGVDKMAALEAAREQQQQLYKIKKEAADKEMNLMHLSETQKKTIMDQMNRQNLLMQKNFEYERQSLIMGSAQTIGDSLTSIAQSMFGKQSGVYKAMFAVSKAFAIADAVIKIQQGIANAAALPWPENLGAMASTAAATASIVSNIEAVVLSFDGGGLTPSMGGVRSGGVDGKGGMYAVVHPDEQVLDLNKDIEVQGLSKDAHGGLNVVINNYADVDISAKQSSDGRQLEVTVRKIMQSIADNDIRTGNGPIGRAIEQTYNVGRGRRA